MSEAFEHLAFAERMGSVGDPTAADMEIINERIALKPQRSSDLFAWSFYISNNFTDAYGTWMDRTSLENYLGQATTGRGVPYMRHHNIDVNEVGRVFDATLDPTSDNPAQSRGTPLARNALRRPREGLRLAERVFAIRKYSEELVALIEAGVSASNSIGFSVYSPASPGSYLECDICREDLMKRNADGVYLCPHIPRVTYEVEHATEAGDIENIEVVATARVVNATQREASGVYLGATPDTHTIRTPGMELLADRARTLYGDGKVSEKDARLYEDVLHLQRGMVTTGSPIRSGYWSVGDLPKTANYGTITVSSTSADNGAAESKEIAMTEYDAGARVLELFADDADREAALGLVDETLEDDPVGAIFRVLNDEVSSVVSERDATANRSEEFRATVRSKMGLDDGEDIADGIDRLMADAAVAIEFRTELDDELIKQMTRAGLDFEADEQRALHAAMTVAQLRTQARMYAATADAQYKAGRISEPSVVSRGDDTPAAPAPDLSQHV